MRGFLNSSEPSRNRRAAFARRRSGVRIPSAPLKKIAVLQVKYALSRIAPTSTQALVQQPCSNTKRLSRVRSSVPDAILKV